MKKNIIFSSALCMLLLAFISCSNEEEVQKSTDEISRITMTAPDFGYLTTRTDFDINENGAAFKWGENDTVGIFPNEGSQVYFPMTSGAGASSASFTGGGWALKSSASYAAYYPFVGDMYLDKTKIPVSYVGQTQTGNGSTAHLGAYDFMASAATTTENGGVNFIFKHLGCLVQLTITVPEPSILTKVVLTSSTEFTETGTIDLTAETPSITADTQSNTVEIALNDVTTTEANEKVIVYFMTAPVDLTDSDLSATIHFADETTSEVELAGKNLQAGKAYRLAAEIEETIPNNQIWYTSSDGKVVDPYIDQYFGATIKSNTYKDGKGVIEFDGDVVSIGSHAFRYCSSLTSVTIPGSVTAIAIYAFYECTALVDVIIPESVARINDFAFARCSSLKNIIIPYGVKNIGGDAFAQCSSLVNVTIPESVKNIGNYAFYVCSSLAEIIIPDSVTSIGSNAFAHCESLANLTIPASVVSIGTEVIRGCVSLSSVVVEPDNKVYDSRNDCNAIIETASNTLIGGCKNSVIPDGVVEIGDDAFRNCSTLSCINIPASVTNIGDRAFSNCSSLSRIDVKATTPPALGEYAISSSTHGDLIVYVPENSVNLYKKTSGWKDLNIMADPMPDN